MMGRRRGQGGDRLLREASIPWVVRAVTYALVASILPSPELFAQGPDRLRDRGPGIPVSMFATYIEEGELLVYPFFEYYRDSDAEYAPEELGYGLDQDFRGRAGAKEGLIFLAYGFSDRLAVEFEAAVISEWLETSPDDPTAVPDRIEESGLGDVEGQIRWRWARETDSGPGIFSYFETVAPLQKDKVLIGTRDWEFKLGTGLVRGFSWGTTTVRMAVEYDRHEDKVEVGEYAIEYLRRLSPSAMLYLGVEGSEDEVEVIPVVRWFLTPNISLHLNSGFGATSKATDWAPEIGLMFSFDQGGAG